MGLESYRFVQPSVIKKLKITLLCSDPHHPVDAYLEKWKSVNDAHHDINIIQKIADITSGDILFLISCSEIMTAKDRTKYSACLVLHASDLPEGRGWSPHIWALEQGAESITLSLIEAQDKIDTGKIWKKLKVAISQSALWDEINHLIFTAELFLIDYAIKQFHGVEPQDQTPHFTPTYYPRRTPKNSQLDPHKTIIEQFNLMRLCDPNRFPAYFEYLGHRYKLKLEKLDE